MNEILTLGSRNLKERFLSHKIELITIYQTEVFLAQELIAFKYQIKKE